MHHTLIQNLSVSCQQDKICNYLNLILSLCHLSTENYKKSYRHPPSPQQPQIRCVLVPWWWRKTHPPTVSAALSVLPSVGAQWR